MAESYQQSSGVSRTQESWLNDTRAKWLGVGVTAVFTLAVGLFIGAIVFLKVDPGLFVRIIYPQFVDAFVLVLGVFVVSGILSVIGGVFVGLGRVSKTSFTYAITTGYVEFFRGTPLLFQLMALYIGIPAFWPPGQFPFANWSIPAAIIGLTLNHSAYVGEAIRGGIAAVPDGQQEAARSLGMSYTQSMRQVILPQAWRNALAAIGNDQVIIVKDTSLLTVIAVPELINAFRSVNSATFDAWTPIVLVAISYLLITIPLSRFVTYLEDRASWGGGDS